MKHARHEAGHHRLMITDLWTLADAWNDSHKVKIDPITLSQCNLPSSVIRYQKLHERVIGGEAPYTQIALEYEIEALSVRYGPALLATAGGKEGSSFLKSISLLMEGIPNLTALKFQDFSWQIRNFLNR